MVSNVEQPSGSNESRIEQVWQRWFAVERPFAGQSDQSSIANDPLVRSVLILRVR